MCQSRVLLRKCQFCYGNASCMPCESGAEAFGNCLVGFGEFLCGEDGGCVRRNGRSFEECLKVAMMAVVRLRWPSFGDVKCSGNGRRLLGLFCHCFRRNSSVDECGLCP